MDDRAAAAAGVASGAMAGFAAYLVGLWPVVALGILGGFARLAYSVTREQVPSVGRVLASLVLGGVVGGVVGALAWEMTGRFGVVLGIVVVGAMVADSLVDGVVALAVRFGRDPLRTLAAVRRLGAGGGDARPPGGDAGA